MIERLIDAQEKAEHAESSWDARVVAAAGVRAILSSLASMGAERVGRTEEETGVRVESAIETAHACNGCGLFASEPDDPCAQCDVPQIEAIIAAKDVALADARARAERAEARLAAVLALTEDDLRGSGLGPNNAGIPGILSLIRWRASEANTSAAPSGDPVLEAISRAPVVTLSADEQAELDRLAKEAQIGPGVSNEVALFGLLKRAREENDGLIAERAAHEKTRALLNYFRNCTRDEALMFNRLCTSLGVPEDLDRSNWAAWILAQGRISDLRTDAVKAWAECETVQTERDDLRARLDETLLKLHEEQTARAIDRAEIAKLDIRWRQHYRDRVALMMFLRHPHMTIAEVVEEVRKQSLHTPLEAEELTHTLATAQELIEQRIASAMGAALGPTVAQLNDERRRAASLEGSILAIRNALGASNDTRTIEAVADVIAARDDAKERIAELEAQISRLGFTRANV